MLALHHCNLQLLVHCASQLHATLFRLSELIIQRAVHVSGGGGGDPPVHLLLFADFLCVAGAGAVEN